MSNVPNVAFAYLYRDGGNNKRYAEAVFANPDGMSLEEADRRLCAAFQGGQHFISDRIGLESAAGDWTHDDDLDHPWNEYFAGDLEATGRRPTHPRTLRAFVESVEAAAAERWDAAQRNPAIYRVAVTDAIVWELHKTNLKEALLDKAEDTLREAIADYEQVEGQDFWSDHQLRVEVKGGEFAVYLDSVEA